MLPGARAAATILLALCGAGVCVLAQRRDAFVASRDHPAIEYTTRTARDPVSALNRRIEDGAARLAFDPAVGYLRATLSALDVPVESQTAVFSQTSVQAQRINRRNPRALYFNDAVAVGWVRGAQVLEVAAQDPEQGVIFYQLDQTPTDRPRFRRNIECLTCHLSWETLGVPGFMVLSTSPLPENDINAYATGFVSDHRSPLDERWGGWYVTGNPGPIRHMGNVFAPKPAARPVVLKSLAGQFDTSGFLSPHSDIVALMVLEHQTRMTNLITRAGWESRLAAHESPGGSGIPDRVRAAVDELVDYLLFVDEAPLAGRVSGSSGFAEQFSARGPRDSRGRSLRQLDLERRLMRYPCSYMIYTDAFDALPSAARDAVYKRMWEILSGVEKGAVYRRLSLADRRAIVEILRETKKDLPPYFQPLSG